MGVGQPHNHIPPPPKPKTVWNNSTHQLMQSKSLDMVLLVIMQQSNNLANRFVLDIHFINLINCSITFCIPPQHQTSHGIPKQLPTGITVNLFTLLSVAVKSFTVLIPSIPNSNSFQITNKSLGHLESFTGLWAIQ